MSDEFIGAGDTQATLTQIISLPGPLVGGGIALLVGMPEPAIGSGQLVAIPEILHFPPLCVCGPRPFTYPFGRQIARKDLIFQITDAAGNPITPFRVTYALFRVLASGALLPFGDRQRHPALISVGRFYPTFRSDDLGQPGNWLIRWTYQESSSSVPVVKDLLFRIHDSFHSKVWMDVTPRRHKHGWF